MTQRGQAAAVIRQVTRVLEEERRGAHFQHRSGEFSLLTPDERNTRRMWGELSSCVGPTFGSLLLTVARAKVHYRMGSYKHLEDLDDVAAKHYKIAHDLLQGVVDAQGLDDEGKATQAEAKRVIGHVHCEWAMALQDMKQYAAAVEHYKAGHAVDKKTHGWVGKVVDVNNPGKYGIPECESLQAAQPGADVAVVGERSREQKDAEGRKRAIDLEAGGGGGASTRTAVRGGETPRKRSRTHEAQLEERVVTARSVTDADQRGGGCRGARRRRVRRLSRSMGLAPSWTPPSQSIRRPQRRARRRRSRRRRPRLHSTRPWRLSSAAARRLAAPPPRPASSGVRET